MGTIEGESTGLNNIYFFTSKTNMTTYHKRKKLQLLYFAVYEMRMLPSS